MEAKALEVLSESSDKKAAHDRATSVHDNAARSMEHARTEIDRLVKKLEATDGAQERLDRDGPVLATLPDRRTARDEMVVARGLVGERASLEARVTELQAAAEELQANIADAERQVAMYVEDAHTDAWRILQEAKSTAQEARDARAARRTELLTRAEGHDAEVKRNQRRLEAVQEQTVDGSCPTCLRPLGEAYTVVLSGLQDMIDAERRKALKCRHDAAGLDTPGEEEQAALEALGHAEAEEEKHRTLRDAAQQAAAARRRDKKALEENLQARAAATKRLDAIRGVPFDAAQLAAAEEEIASLEALDMERAIDRALVSQREETAALLEERNRMLAKAQEEIRAAQATIKELSFNAEDHARHQAVAEEARSLTTAAKVEMGRAEEAVTGARERVRTATEALAGYDSRAARLKEASADHLLHEKTAARLDSFRIAIASTIRPEMEELMSGFVQLLTDGRHEAVTLTESFDTIVHEGGAPMEVVSGGAEDIIALAMRLALSQLIAERAGHPLSLLVLDEPFGHMDEARRANVLGLVRRLSSIFEQVIIISHVAETRECADTLFEFSFDEGTRRTSVAA